MEDINSKLSVIVKGHQVLRNDIEKVDKKIDTKITELRDEMVVRFDYLDRKIDGVHDELNKKIDNVHDELSKKTGNVHDELIDTRNELKHEIRHVSNVTDNHEQRITEIEKVVNL